MTSAFNQDGSCAGGVVLLHGIARSARSRRRMQVALETAGFATLNLDYQSRAKSLQALVADISPAITGFASRIDGPMHFVAHSMSGLLARAYPNIRCCAPGASFCSARQQWQRDRRPLSGPADIRVVDKVPLLGSGKTDYVGATALAKELVASTVPLQVP